MELGDLEKRVLQGDQEAFVEWMGLHLRKIGLFAIQVGAAPDDAEKVVEAVFRNRYANFEDAAEDDLKQISLLQSALHQLGNLQPSDSPVDLFTFEEDNELHRRLTALPIEYRVPFILDRFHNMTHKNIADIIGGSEQQVEQALANAYSLLGEPNLDKKLEFLNKSYERLSRFLDERKIDFEKAEEAPLAEQKKETVKNKRSFLFWGAGIGALLILLSMVTYMNSRGYQTKSAGKFMEAAEASFQEELERNLRVAGLPAPDYLRRDIYGETYGEDTRRKFNWFIADLEDQLETDGRIDRAKAEKDFDLLMDELMIPSEMVKNLSRSPLVDDHGKSIEFVNEYMVKMSTLLKSYIYIVQQNETLIRENGRNGEGGYDIEAFYAKKSTYPEAFQRALDGMEAQGIVLNIDTPDRMPVDYLHIHPNVGTPELSKALHENLHPDTSIFITVLMADLVDLHNRSVKEQTDFLFQLEKGLFQAEGYERLYSLTFNAYSSVLHLITGLGANIEIRNSDGTIKEEYKEAWTRIAFNGANSPSGHMMREVIIEMEESGWTASSYLDKFQYFFIEAELRKIIQEMEKEG